jgi:hypothetical protein
MIDHDRGRRSSDSRVWFVHAVEKNSTGSPPRDFAATVLSAAAAAKQKL